MWFDYAKIYLHVFFLSFFLSGRLSLAHEWYSVKRVNEGDILKKDLGSHENTSVRSRLIWT